MAEQQADDAAVAFLILRRDLNELIATHGYASVIEALAEFKPEAE